MILELMSLEDFGKLSEISKIVKQGCIDVQVSSPSLSKEYFLRVNLQC